MLQVTMQVEAIHRTGTQQEAHQGSGNGKVVRNEAEGIHITVGAWATTTGL